jgi:glycosyltransferase involved in cell wall biosynthesis
LATVQNANIAAVLASALAGFRSRLVLREANPSEFDAKTTSYFRTLIAKLALRVLYPLADAVIAISGGVQKSLLEFVRLEASKIVVIHNPYTRDPCGDPPAPADSITNRRHSIVACGRLQPQKDHSTLIVAFARLARRRDATLTLLGDGPLRLELEALAVREGVHDRVLFAGFQPHPQAWMRSADLFVHSSRWEGFGIVLLEALHAGCPIVATDCPGGVREVLDNGRFGVLVPVGDPASLADAMEAVLLKQVRLENPSDYLKRFELDHVSREYVRILLPRATD